MTLRSVTIVDRRRRSVKTIEPHALPFLQPAEVFHLPPLEVRVVAYAVSVFALRATVPKQVAGKAHQRYKEFVVPLSCTW